jgi:hypothetical protein
MTAFIISNSFEMMQFTDVHLSVLLGLPALLLLYTGVILYYISKEKYTFAHGICAGLALLLTTVNIVAVLPLTGTILGAGAADLFHIIHIALGAIGYLAGVGAFLTGISGIRTRVPGATAAVCWTIVFVMGYILYIA